MNSKEIINAHIEHFEKCRKAYIKASDIETANEYKKDIETFKTILQDLERLEELEKENRELIRKADCCMWIECNKISEENEELKDTIAKTYSEFGFSNLSDFRKEVRKVFIENQKLKNAIQQAIELLSVDGKGTKQQVKKMLSEVVKNVIMD